MTDGPPPLEVTSRIAYHRDSVMWHVIYLHLSTLMVRAGRRDSVMRLTELLTLVVPTSRRVSVIRSIVPRGRSSTLLQPTELVRPRDGEHVLHLPRPNRWHPQSQTASNHL